MKTNNITQQQNEALKSVNNTKDTSQSNIESFIELLNNLFSKPSINSSSMGLNSLDNLPNPKVQAKKREEDPEKEVKKEKRKEQETEDREEIVAKETENENNKEYNLEEVNPENTADDEVNFKKESSEVKTLDQKKENREKSEDSKIQEAEKFTLNSNSNHSLKSKEDLSATLQEKSYIEQNNHKNNENKKETTKEAVLKNEGTELKESIKETKVEAKSNQNLTSFNSEFSAKNSNEKTPVTAKNENQNKPKDVNNIIQNAVESVLNRQDGKTLDTNSRTNSSLGTESINTSKKGNLKTFSLTKAKTHSSSLQDKIIERIQSMLKNAKSTKNGTSMVVRLDPPQLGKVTVKLTQRSDQLFAKIIPESKDVERTLKSRSADIVNSLVSSGFKVENINLSFGANEEVIHSSSHFSEMFNNNKNEEQNKNNQNKKTNNFIGEFSSNKNLAQSSNYNYNRAQESGWIA